MSSACAPSPRWASVTAVLPPLLLGAGPPLCAAAAAGLLPADRPGAVRAAPRRGATRPRGLRRGHRDLVVARASRVVLLGVRLGRLCRVGAYGVVRGDRSCPAAPGGDGRGGGPLGRPAAGLPPGDLRRQLLVLRLA